MQEHSTTRENVTKLIEQLMRNNVLHPADIRMYQRDYAPDTPEAIRGMLEDWYRGLGIETIIQRRLILSDCPFTKEEIALAKEENECILCLPKAVNRVQLSTLFRIDSWAVTDRLVTRASEAEDFWFRTKMTPSPSAMGRSGLETLYEHEAAPYAPFSLERYLVFIGWYRNVTGETPDSEYWIWLPRGRYDRSGMLIAGFDRFHNFNVHGWMPQFFASFLGSRYCILPNK